jgi:diguanylate cyclase (GGDEF)-like protein
MDLIQSLESGNYSDVAPLRRNQRQTLALLSAEGRARLTRLYSQCEKLVDISRAKLEDAQARVRQTVERAERAAVWTAAAAGGGTLIVAAVLALSLISPLKNLLRGVGKVTAGDLTVELPVEGADEVGRLTQEFNAMIRQLRDKQERLLAETVTDSLTELHNFRYFQSRLKDEISRAARHQRPFGLLILDIDHFKHYNDTNGHQMGNVLLKQMAATLREALRREDFIARYGGEEFVAILPETDRAGAAVVAERLRQAIEQTDFPARGSQPGGRLTVSVGGALFPSDASVAAGLIEKADKALYAAKKAGRNRVVWSADQKVSAA